MNRGHQRNITSCNAKSHYNARGAISSDWSIGKSSAETILPGGPWEGRGLAPISWVDGGAVASPMINQILYFVLEGPTIVCIMSRSIYVISTTCILIISLGGGPVMGLVWILMTRLAFHNFWYDCDNGLVKGVNFQTTLFELRGRRTCNQVFCWWVFDWFARYVIEGDRLEEMGTQFG